MTISENGSKEQLEMSSPKEKWPKRADRRLERAGQKNRLEEQGKRTEIVQLSSQTSKAESNPGHWEQSMLTVFTVRWRFLR